MAKKAYTRWIPEEFTLVAAHALPLVDDKGFGLIEAYAKAQRFALAERRWKDIPTLRRMATSGNDKTLAKYLKLVREMPPEQRPALKGDAALVRIELPSPRKRGPEPKPKVEYRGNVRWTDSEKALLARWVMDRRRNHHDKRALTTMFVYAQDEVLPIERRRSRHGIWASQDNIERAFAFGSANQKLIEQPLQATTTAFEEAISEHLERQPASEPAERAAPPLATVAPGMRQIALSEAARAFGETMMGALDTLLGAHAALIMGEVRQRLDRIGNDVALNLQSSIAQMVHSALEKELGPVAAPDAPVMAAPPEPAPKRLVVDVIGLTGHAAAEVRSAFNGNTDIRVIDQSKIESWSPRTPNTILVTKFTGHAAEFKLKRAGLKPIRVNGAAGSVIEAIKALHQQQGIGVH